MKEPGKKRHRSRSTFEKKKKSPSSGSPAPMSSQPNTAVWILVPPLGEGTSPLQLQNGTDDKLCFAVAGRVSTSTKMSSSVQAWETQTWLPQLGVLIQGQKQKMDSEIPIQCDKG